MRLPYSWGQPFFQELVQANRTSYLFRIATKNKTLAARSAFHHHFFGFFCYRPFSAFSDCGLEKGSDRKIKAWKMVVKGKERMRIAGLEWYGCVVKCGGSGVGLVIVDAIMTIRNKQRHNLPHFSTNLLQIASLVMAIQCYDFSRFFSI